jgi:hypothetical protein
VATTGSFATGLRDGYPIYQIIKRPPMPKDPSAGYGAGMALTGVGSVFVGLLPLVGYAVSNGRKATGVSTAGAHGKALSMVIFGASALWAAPHVLLGVGSAFTGARIVALGS